MIYLDNASTSHPKADGLAEYVKQYIEKSCFNVNRGAYSSSIESAEVVFETRELVAEFFGATRSKNVIFTSGITHSLNVVTKGLLKRGDVVVTTSMEHNAVYRPLRFLESQGVTVRYAKCNSLGEVDLVDLEKKLSSKPKMLVMTHASNVCGTIMPITKIGELCKKYGVVFVLDSAQSAGTLPIDVVRDNIDVLCFAGHKGLLGLPGVGGIVFSDKTAQETSPFVHGGTGSFSHLADLPQLLPDKFESGTLNLVGIAGLGYCINYLNDVGIQNIYKHEKDLQIAFEQGLQSIKDVKLVGASQNRCAVSALDFVGKDNGEIAYQLDDSFGIMTRSGLHCAPLAHQTLGTSQQGVVRVSFGHKNTLRDVEHLIHAIKQL